VNVQETQETLQKARQGVSDYLEAALKAGRIDRKQFEVASAKVVPNLQKWLEDPELDRIARESPCAGAKQSSANQTESPAKLGIADAVRQERWEDIVNAFRKTCSFGTGGIRGMMAFDREAIRRFQGDFNATFLRGPNTINDIVLLLTSAGVARFGNSQPRPFSKVVVGYDSRVRGQDLARCVASLFLAYGYTVFLFDEPCPYPEVTFAIPDAAIRADVGIFISASHNDYRYNGYKLSSGNGSQFDPKQRDEMYEQYIVKATTKDIKFRRFEEAGKDKLVFLGGAEPLSEFDYHGREKTLINIHAWHASHMKSFLLTPDLAEQQKKSASPLRIGYCAFHGAGRKAVPRLLRDVGFQNVKSVTRRGLNDLNGLFPCFSSDPGREQQPDPGDPHSAEIAVEAFQEEYPGEWEKTDLLIGTDPDADRCGVVVKVPENQRSLYGGKDYTLLSADDVWALLVWYRLTREMEQAGTKTVPDAAKKFIVLSHTTSDCITRVAQKFGLGVIRTWVGFASLAAGVRDTWDKKPVPKLVDGRSSPSDKLCHPFVCDFLDMDNGQRSFNVAAMEQSNGFSLLGGPPPDEYSLGVGGHVRDKDGTFAALLVAEVAAWAKEQGTSLMELLDQRICLDPDIGLWVTRYEPDPLIGEYPGIEGDRKKLDILGKALMLDESARRAGGVTRRAGGVSPLMGVDSSAAENKGEIRGLTPPARLEIAGLPVKSSVIYRTGKYDRIYPPSGTFVFPDEGVRLFFNDAKTDHVTIRPSGTGNSLRFHVQLHADVTKQNLFAKKKELRERAKAIVDDVRKLIDAPREG
jgi:phosphoglucomutase